MKSFIKKYLTTWFERYTGFKKNKYHPLVWIVGDPIIGSNVYIGGFSEINANGAEVKIGSGCDIASYVTINCASSHKKCIGLIDVIERKDICIGNNVFIGSHSVIKGGAVIGDNSVIGAASVVGEIVIPPYSLAIGNPVEVKPGYYLKK